MTSWKLFPASLIFGLFVASASAELCSTRYAPANAQSSEITFAIQELQQHPIAAWYTDNAGNVSKLARDLVATCAESTTMILVVYGLPNKDCDAGYSNHGTNKSPQDYARFIQSLADIVGQRKILYVLEPDAVGLAAKEGGCGQQSGYQENVAKAIGILSSNPNAEIYLDVGFWTLMSTQSASQVATLVKQLAQAGRIKGIALNTSNYRSNDESAKLCSNFQNAMGSDSMHCIIDSSRNYNGASASNEWCNVHSGGIGKPPTSSTGYPNIDYLVWIKPPGESDGTCDGSDRSADALRGPVAGAFFDEYFKLLWNQGYFVKERGMKRFEHVIVPAKWNANVKAKQSGNGQTVIWVVVVVVAVGVALVGTAGTWWWRKRRAALTGQPELATELLVDSVDSTGVGSGLRDW